MPIFGVDVSHHQGPNLDWAKIRRSGIDFMFARASLATTPDERYRRNHARAGDAGIPVLGAYHFLYPEKVAPGETARPVDQARLFVDQIRNPDGLLTMLDIERDGKHKPRIHHVREFAEEFASLTGGHPLLLYAPGWYWPIIDNPPASDLGPLVASRYVKVDRNDRDKRVKMSPEVAFGRVGKGWWKAKHGGWARATILQFTSFGKVAGHPGRIDLNAFRGTPEELAGLGHAGPGFEPFSDPDDELPDDLPEDDDPDGGMTHGLTDLVSTHGIEGEGLIRFHRVRAGDTLSAIAARFGWKPKGGRPAFRVMLDAFPENEPFRAHPDTIHPGDRVRVR